MMWWRQRIDAGTVLKKQVNFLKFPKMRRSNVINYNNEIKNKINNISMVDFGLGKFDYN